MTYGEHEPYWASDTDVDKCSFCDEVVRLKKIMLEAAIILDKDGDEHGVAHMLRAVCTMPRSSARYKP